MAAQTILQQHLETLDETARERVHAEFRTQRATVKSDADENALMLELIVNEHRLESQAQAQKKVQCCAISKPILLFIFCFSPPPPPGQATQQPKARLGSLIGLKQTLASSFESLLSGRKVRPQDLKAFEI